MALIDLGTVMVIGGIASRSEPAVATSLVLVGAGFPCWARCFPA